MSWALWFLIACAAIAVLLAGSGALMALRAARALRLRADDVVPHELLVRLTAAQHDVERLQGGVAGIEALLGRLRAALAALRLAGVAIRLLLAAR